MSSNKNYRELQNRHILVGAQACELFYGRIFERSLLAMFRDKTLLLQTISVVESTLHVKKKYRKSRLEKLLGF